MLQEILLSLSGIDSPLWEKLKTQGETDDGLKDYVSPSEHAMLTRLAYLSQLHVEVKNQTNVLSAKHPSPVCRAVSSAISQKHLSAFGKRILEVESSILQGDASHVGGYQIVPLSTLVADFEPWIRRMEWLRRVTQFVKGIRTKEALSNRTAAAVMKFLDTERQTGFTDLEDFATQLLIVAQTTWMRSIMSWILYGQLPSVGHQDFMVQKSSDDDMYEQYVLAEDLTPEFVSKHCAENILAIGNAVIQMRLPGGSMDAKMSRHTIENLQKEHLVKIKLLQYPLNSSLFDSTITSLNSSISRDALSMVLPLAEVVDVCRMLKDYMLLGRGEFAISLIDNSDTRVNSRGKSHLTVQPVRKVGRAEELDFKEIELDAILSKTLSDLNALQADGDRDGIILDRAKMYLRLRLAPSTASGSEQLPLATLLPAPTTLQVDLPSSSSLRLFLSPSDSRLYSKICAYLLSLRRSQLRISSLWKLTSQRRCHPTPIGPPLSATAFGRRACELRRKRENVRAVQTRRFWSSTNKALFILSELNSYIQGEVIGNSWRQFEMWLDHGGQNQHLELFPDTHESEKNQSLTRGREQHSLNLKSNERSTFVARKDPRALACAHTAYLTNLGLSLLVEERSYVSTLKALLEIIDHLVALFGRLSTAWEGLDLQEDDGVLDAFTNFAQDEKSIIIEMDRTRNELEHTLEQLVKNIKDAEKTQSQTELSGAIASVRIAHDEEGDFVPWRVRTLDRLIMKLDFMYNKEDGGDNLVDDLEYE